MKNTIAIYALAFLIVATSAIVYAGMRQEVLAQRQIAAIDAVSAQLQAQADRQVQVDRQAQADRQAFIDRHSEWVETVGKEWGCDKVTSINVEQDGVTYNYLCVSEDGTVNVSWKVPEE